MRRAELIKIINQRKSLLCVGLDPDPDKFPPHLKDYDNPVLQFCKEIIEFTAPYTIAYKTNTAFFEALGPKGWETLYEVKNLIPKSHFSIADAKRGDIGNTSKRYAHCFFNEFDFDAVTITPYMGEDSVKPFMEFNGKWAIVLTLTSNIGANDFQQQFLKSNGQRLYKNVIEKCLNWGSSENTMYVVGATRPEQLAEIRTFAPDHFLLVPGVGSQGGTVKEVCQAAATSYGGLFINASRSIIYAGGDHNFGEMAGLEAKRLQQEMSKFLPATNPTIL